MSNNKLLKNTLIYTVGNLGSRILSFLIVPLYSFYLSKSELGQYDLLLSSTGIFMPFISLQISDSVYRWLIEAKGSFEVQQRSITSGLMILLINSGAFLVLYLLLRRYLHVDYAGYVVMILFLIITYTFVQQAVRGLGKNKLYSFSGIIYTGLFLATNCIMLLNNSLNIQALLLSTCFSYSITLLFVIIKSGFFKYINFKRWSWVEVKKMIHYSTPLIPNTISWWLINEVNKFIILSNLTLDDNGIYAIANKFPTILTVINSVFMLAWQDQALEGESGESVKSYNTEVYKNFIRLQLTLSLLLIAISKYVAMYMVGEQFFSAWKYMPLLYLGVCYSSIAGFLGAFYLKTKLTKGLFVTTIVGGIVNVIVSFALIKNIGLYAPALGTFLGFLVVWLMRSTKTSEHVDIKAIRIDMISLTSVSLLFIGLVLINNYYVDIVIVIASIVIFIFANYSLLNAMVTKIKSIYNKSVLN